MNEKQKQVTESINVLAEKTKHNLPDAFKRMANPEYSAKKAQAYRDRLAVRLRESKRRVRENKARNNGVYQQEIT